MRKHRTGISDAGSGSDLGDGDDELTVVDGDIITPTELPRCTECGNVVFFDDFTEPASALAAGLFQSRTCVRARDQHWHWCSDLRKYVYYVPR